MIISPKADREAGDALITLERHDGEGMDLVLKRETQPQLAVAAVPPEEAYKGPIDPGTPPFTPQNRPTSGE